jgi:hypothetical protein
MLPDDRVLVAVMNRPKDFEVARDEGWYRVPEKRAPRSLFFEYVAFYFTGAFGDEKWAVHYYARRLGHELVTRRTLLPDEPDHPRAGDLYYKLQLGPLQRREPPIVSLRWRRIAFIHTTWDRFEAAEEINDLFVEGGEYVDRLYHALREVGLAAERRYPVRDAGVEYIVDLALPCREGVLAVDIVDRETCLPGSLRFTVEQIGDDPTSCLASIRAEVHWRGGLLSGPQGRDKGARA